MLKKKSHLHFILIISVMMLVSSCSKYQKLLRSDDHEKKYEKAIEYYYEEEYSKTISLLSDVIHIYRGTRQAETINYYFAKAHFKQGDYLLASHYFQTFVTSYPRSEHAEEFMYLAAYCKYLQSPRYSLDQTTTREAIQEFQRFINRYPESEKVAEVNYLIDELRYKLEKKRFENANLYYNLNDFTAAATTYNNLIRDFPGTDFTEEALFLTVKSYYNFASMSIPQRQVERYQKVLDSYNRLLRNFPETQFFDQANKMYVNAIEFLENNKDAEDITLLKTK